MVPVRLELKNFLSYGEDVVPLDFRGMHTVCLSGENGHGKSALLDAVTWALWGESRAGKNKHDDLIRHGSDEMSVQFTFSMDEQLYRVLRKRSKRTSGNQWELQQEMEGGVWRSLTGNSMLETERGIQKLLRMSYETFINSAYLRQGTADQFVKQTPGKRKEILAEILDLSRYDRLETKARERARTLLAEATDVERDMRQMDAELAGEGALRETLETLRAQHDALCAEQEALKAEWETLRGRRSELEQQGAIAESLRQQLATLQDRVKELGGERDEHTVQAGRWSEVLTRRESTVRNYEEWVGVRAQLLELEKKMQGWYRIQQSLAVAEKEWQAEEARVRHEADRAARAADEALARLTPLAELRAQYEAVRARVAEASRLSEVRQVAANEMTEARAELSSLEQDSKHISAEIARWDERLAALGNQTGVCMVCNSPLPPDRIAETERRYRDERAGVVKDRQGVWAEAKRCKARIAERDSQVKDLDKALAGLGRDQQALGQLEQRVRELAVLESTLPKLNEERDSARGIWEAREFAPEIRRKMVALQGEIAEARTIPDDYQKAKDRSLALAAAEKDFTLLDHAEQALKTAQAGVDRAVRDLGRCEEQRAAARKQLDGLASIAPEIEKALAREREIRDREKERGARERSVNQEMGSRQQELERLARMRGARVEKLSQLTTLRTDQEAHEQLARAFGKKGVQALIIENAIPEIQEEANRLLDRLTDGDMSVFFETTREAKGKKDQTIETLDIKVSDSMGTRPLEMYSGGEGFRAAFAIRIALSKLLTRRAGARLQTLIIDEGFGTQDVKGREKLVDSLNAVKDDFEKIIVITHIEELKDAFATRIEVLKTHEGSQIAILEGSAG